jgi:hypothetical protein
MRASPAFNYGLLGLAAGALVSILFFPLNFLVALVLLGPLLAGFIARPPGGRIRHFITCGVGLATVAVAIVLPVKQLDRRVGPFRYGRMSLDQLTQRLEREHRVFVMVDESIRTNMIDSFVAERAMSRRDVLGKLAREAACELHIGYCGTGATFLFGAHPSFTRLHVRELKTVANATESIRSETNTASRTHDSGR